MDWVLPLRSDWATPIAKTFSILGYSPFFLVFLPLAYWLWDRERSTRLVVLICLTGLLNAWLKDFWQDPRPGPEYALDPEVGTSFGRPSGHAQVSAVMWLWLAHELKRPWAWAAAIFIIAGVSFSRLYLGVHDLDDVAAGLALGVATFGVVAWATGPSIDLGRRLPPIARLAVVAALVPIASWTWPMERGPGRATPILFLLFGWLVGRAFDQRLAPERPVAWWKGSVVAIVGIAAIFTLRAGFVAIGAGLGLSESATGDAATLAIGLFTTWLAPLAFRALGLLG